MGEKKQHVYIIGSKGIPAKYGGFETFVEKLTEYQSNEKIQYHVACMAENSAKSGIDGPDFEYNGAKCFNVAVPNIGPARAIYYDIAALKQAIRLAEDNQDHQPIFYVLACRIGPFIGKLKQQISNLNGKLFVNPDGHEWKRGKWSYPVRRYWKHSERLMVKHADLLICDSQTIEKYIRNDYRRYHPKTTYIAYGTDLEKSKLTASSPTVQAWFTQKKVQPNNYYLVVGRFVPENNYETMIQEFMQSETKKDFVLITNVEQNKFYDRLKKQTQFDQDPRIKFVGTVYDQELLKYIRQQAFAYLHGHEVGGTNPSLLEALAMTKLNMLLDVGFNREVGENRALYWQKEAGSLKNQIHEVEGNINRLFETTAPTNPIAERFCWDYVIDKYEEHLGG